MTWSLIVQSFRVLRKDKKLVLFPFMSALAALLVSAPFFLMLVDIGDRSLRRTGWSSAPWYIAWYLAASFVMIFFNCALAACAQVRFSGGEPKLADGIRRAAGRAGSILAWALVSSTVGAILQSAESRLGSLGRVIIGIFGIAWNMVTFLIVPVLVIENLGPMDTIRRSRNLLRKSWGEQLVMGLAFGWTILLFAIPGVILGAIGANFQPAVLIAAVLYFVLLAAVMTAVRGVFVVALYRYATTGSVPDGFADEHFVRDAGRL